MRLRQPSSCSHPHARRRGVTLVEMLVAVTLLVLMMTVLVTIFTSATGAVSGLQAFQQLDGDLRQLDTTIRRDLIGVTAKMTPPLDPNKNLGYFEIGENAFADLQGEDTDDYIRFTAKAPEGQPFTGRAWFGSAWNSPGQPVLITSQYAEIIYFLRNGNLYRRVLLIAPERQQAVNTAWVNAGGTPGMTTALTFQSDSLGGLSAPWQGVNDLSARPAPSGSVDSSISYAAPFPIQLNTLGDLTNRENRAFYPRFANDYYNLVTQALGPDGIPDDINPDPTVTGPTGLVGDGVPDYYPTLYPLMPGRLLNEPTTATRSAASTDTLAFPYIYPGAYSRPDEYAASLTGAGWIHSTDPSPAASFTGHLDQLEKINHTPIQVGDSLLYPGTPQTWFGFPLWRETLLPRWADPNVQVLSGAQPDGLHPSSADVVPPVAALYLPPMTELYRERPQPFNDGRGLALPAVTATETSQTLWRGSWDDDLIMTGVRSFDVKVYDNAYPGYVDLGWGDDLRLYPPGIRPTTPPFLAETPNTSTWTSGTWYTLTQTFAHEGRMPPLEEDLRQDAQFPNPFYPTPQYSNYPLYTGNVGTPAADTNLAKVMRLRRVWDTWSTDYSNAPATGFHPTTKLPWGPPFSPPIYPSYPAPYPVAMRGIQIQIRVADPRDERVKLLTIRQDFSDKL